MRIVINSIIIASLACVIGFLSYKLIVSEKVMSDFKATTSEKIENYAKLLSALKKDDISMEESVSCNREIPGNVWLISYADGPDIYLANERYQVHSGLNKCIDFYKPYNVRHIDPEYYRAHSKIFMQRRGVGYWLWKPYLILKTLE